MSDVSQQKNCLSISIVTFSADYSRLEQTLDTLRKASLFARNDHKVNGLDLYVIDNGPGEADHAGMARIVSRERADGLWDQVRFLTGHGNVGYGKGHNMALASSHCAFHLVLNPDVLLQQDAILQALDFMLLDDTTGIIVPMVFSEQGKTEYLCKRYPSILDLVVRGFAPRAIKKIFAPRLERYEMRDIVDARQVAQVILGSGAFMFCRTAVVNAVGGFQHDYFMYFEDFDLSLRIAPAYKVMFVPAVQITHFGGAAAKKGSRHVRMFVRSAITFFSRHGWKWF